MRKCLAVAAPLMSVVMVLAACSSKAPPRPSVPSTVDAGTWVPEAGTWQAEAGSPVAASDAGPTFFTGDAGAPGMVEQALDTAIDLAIATSAPKVAPKMDKEGQPGRATLKEGDHFSMMITMVPNRCYTIVGFSPPGAVSQFDIKLYGPPLFNVEAGRSTASDKAAPVVGKGNAALCPVLPFAVPYKIDAVATKGAGRIGLSVFARTK